MTREQQAHPGQVAFDAAKAKWDVANVAARNAYAVACITYDNAYAAACDAYDAEVERINKEYPR
jgi:hypothetical protein